MCTMVTISGVLLVLFVQTATASPDEYSVRLINGPNSCSGRVEIFHGGSWGTVCDDRWNLKDAQVVCRELGCGMALSAPGKARFGQGDGDILLDEVQCSGDESRLSDCNHSTIGTHNCAHREDASVVCEGVVFKLQVKCPTGWDEYSGHCYKYETTSKDWADAERVCLAQGANLASIHSAGEHKFIQDLILANTGGKAWEWDHTWAGGCDAAKEGVWLWSDGSEVSYTAWSGGQPDNFQSSQDCMGVNWGSENLWDDMGCTDKFPSVCKKPADALTTVT